MRYYKTIKQNIATDNILLAISKRKFDILSFDSIGHFAILFPTIFYFGKYIWQSSNYNLFTFSFICCQDNLIESCAVIVTM